MKDPVTGMIQIGETFTPKYYIPHTARPSFVPITASSHTHITASAGTTFDSISVTSPRKRISTCQHYESGGNEDLAPEPSSPLQIATVNQMLLNPNTALLPSPSPLVMIHPPAAVPKWKKKKAISRPKACYSPFASFSREVLQKNVLEMT